MLHFFQVPNLHLSISVILAFPPFIYSRTQCNAWQIGFFFVCFFFNFIVVQVQFSAFSPHPSLPPSTPVIVHVSFMIVPTNPSPFSPEILSPLTVSLFSISVSLVIFCLFVCFVDQVPVKGEIIWYLSLTSWLISLSIMLSSPIHTVSKGRSSFFLSAA